MSQSMYDQMLDEFGQLYEEVTKPNRSTVELEVDLENSINSAEYLMETFGNFEEYDPEVEMAYEVRKHLGKTKKALESVHSWIHEAYKRLD